ncbi:MAG: hypothetical protein OHK0039_23010 [Bacteroidia bacterium]
MKHISPLTPWLLLLGALLWHEGLVAQRTCGTDAYLEQLLQDPTERAHYEARQRYLQAYLAQHRDVLRNDSVYTIPVVFHVVYKNETENISDAQLQSQIDVLNEDFRRLNADTSNTPLIFKPVVADIHIEFCLASYDPDGSPTTGITRTLTTEASFSTDDRVKYDSTGGKTAWPADQYLNYWVCDLGGGLLGYASTAGHGRSGVVVGYNYTGRVGTLDPSFNLGRTATHEVGHWLGLSHTWGSGGCSADDGIADTPIQDQPNYGCETYPHISCSNGPLGGDMFMNYMDYSDDACFSLFTQDQRDVMRAYVVPGGPYRSLITSYSCVNPSYNDIGVAAIASPDDIECGSDFVFAFLMKNYGKNPVTEAKLQIQVDGVNVGTFTWTGNLDTGQTTLVTYAPTTTFAPGPHNLFIYTDGVLGFPDPDNSNDGKIKVFEVLDNLGQPVPYLEGFESTIYPPAGWVIDNPDNDITWERSTAAALFGSGSIMIENYDYNNVGAADEFVLPDLDLTTFAHPGMSFWVAYAQFGANTGFADTLEVWVSGDCGKTYQLEYKQYGPGLATAAPSANPFVPNVWQWRQEWLDLSAYGGNTGVSIKFRSINNQENNLYLDNINIREVFTVSLDPEALAGQLSLWPNPAHQRVVLEATALEAGEVALRMIDMQGRVVRSELAQVQTVARFEWELAGLAPGVYLIELQQGQRRATSRLIIE